MKSSKTAFALFAATLIAGFFLAGAAQASRTTPATEATPPVIDPELRALVRFQRLNLNDESYAAPMDCDLVLCRNVLIYFQPELKARVVERLLRHLAPDGCLFLGHAESLAGLAGRVRSIGPNVYSRAPEKSR